jgi:guanylate kinase
MYQNKIIILTAPSGAGKTSITHFLLREFPQLAFSISVATRKRRENEVDGKDYYFMTEEEFHIRNNKHEFVEWEMVYEGKIYGTLKSELERIWNNKQVPVLDIDVKGAIHVQEQYPGTTLSIFIDPPSVDELRRRLSSRGTETEESLEIRINKASYEISFKHHFSKIILNDNFEKACAQAKEAVQQFLES